MGVVDEAVEDGVGVGRLADDGMPGRDRQLAGDDGGAPAVAVLKDLEQVVTGLGVQRFQAPVVQDQQLHGGQALEAAPDAAVSSLRAAAAGIRRPLREATHLPPELYVSPQIQRIEDAELFKQGWLQDVFNEKSIAESTRAIVFPKA